MSSFEARKDILVHLFGDIMDIEHKVIITGEFKELTNNDMHIIAIIGMNKPKNMSRVAKELSVTVGTLTIAINSLVKKGYVKRIRSEEDRRVVFLSLSQKGQKAYAYHNEFYENMMQAALDGLEDEEITVLTKVLDNLHNHFQKLEVKGSIKCITNRRH